MASNYFEHSERFLRDLGIGSETPLNTAEKWLSTTQLLYREARPVSYTHLTLPTKA